MPLEPFDVASRAGDDGPASGLRKSLPEAPEGAFVVRRDLLGGGDSVQSIYIHTHTYMYTHTHYIYIYIYVYIYICGRG